MELILRVLVMNTLRLIKDALEDAVTIPEEKRTMFFKSEKGSYSEHDQFIGVTVPNIRKIAKQYAGITFNDIKFLFESPYNEERMLALIILVNKNKKASHSEKEKIYQFYCENLDQVNNWNLVDASAHLIIGAHLIDSKKGMLLDLAKSQSMWHRRIAIVSTWYFIRHQQLEWTFKIAKILLQDEHDLIHKATGWMLREAGKEDQQDLVKFLDQYAVKMPRTMLRYAIEKFPEPKRQYYLCLKGK